jgi:leucine dehydrogenase
MLTIKEIKVPGYHKVIEAINPAANLHSFIAIHDMTLGPSLGGTRIYPYSNPEEALEDVLRLAKAMTYKSALIEDGLGGGKSVIIAAKKDKNPQLLMAFAEALDRLKGDYIAAEDVGTTTDDMLVIKSKTPYVCALPTDKSSGDPSRFTAWGVFRGILAVCKKLWDSHNLHRKKIAIQGLGNVGSKLANILFWEGAELILTDTDPKKLHDITVLYGAELVSPDEIYKCDCDIFSPCGMGGTLNDETIPKLRCAAIAGAANNQLLLPDHGRALMERGILYCPDYVINSGGISNAAAEFDPGGYNPKLVRDKVNHIYPTLRTIFNRSDQSNKPTSQIADEMAEYNLKNGIGKRSQPIIFERKS